MKATFSIRHKLVALLILSTITASAQFNSSFETMDNNLNTSVVNFTVQEVEGRLYFNYKALNDTVLGIFVLERRSDNKPVESVGVQKNCPNNVNLPILYSFIDENPNEYSTNYQLVKYTKKGKEVIVEYTHRAGMEAWKMQLAETVEED